MLVVWVFEVISNEAKRSGVPGPIHAAMNNEVQKVGDSIKRLFSYQYQVSTSRHARTDRLGASCRARPPAIGVGVSAPRHMMRGMQSQVLPFIYTHLVSLSSTLFLAFSAFLKGLYFTPAVGYLFGLSLPLCSMLMQVIACRRLHAGGCTQVWLHAGG